MFLSRKIMNTRGIISAEELQNYTDNTNFSTSKDVTSCPLGTDTVTRIVALALRVEHASGSSGMTLDSVVIAGVTATAATGGQNRTGIYYAVIPAGTGTTGTITFNVSGGTANHTAFTSHAIYNYTSSAVDQNYGNGSVNPTSTTLDTTTPCVILGAGKTSTATTTTWSGTTEDLDGTTGAGDTYTTSHEYLPTESATYAVSCTFASSGGNESVVWALFI